MLPVLHPGDVLYVKKVSLGKLKINDIALLKKYQRIFIHRVIYKAKNYLISKGDANLKTDGKIFAKNIIGKVYKIKSRDQVINLDHFYLLQSTSYFEEIVNLKNSLEKENVNFVFLKGLPLHLYFEKTHPRRFFFDCDVLIRKRDFKKVKKTLTKLGYTKTDRPLSRLHQGIKDKTIETSFRKIINEFPVVFDVHFEPVFMMNQLSQLEALYPQGLVNQMSDNFLKEKKWAKIYNQSLPILSFDNLVLYLALHFFHHNFRGYFRLELLSNILKKVLPRKAKLKKKLTFENALCFKIKKYRISNFVYPTFLLLKKYFNGNLSDTFLNQIKPERKYLNRLKKKIASTNIFEAETRVKAGIERFKNIFFLSPNPFYKKIQVFLNPAVIYSIAWIIYRKLLSYGSLLAKEK